MKLGVVEVRDDCSFVGSSAHACAIDEVPGFANICSANVDFRHQAVPSEWCEKVETVFCSDERRAVDTYS